jgi:hypothetical protein
MGGDYCKKKFIGLELELVLDLVLAFGVIVLLGLV